ncbi:GtrA family protein [Oceanispirochaeta sp. M2]|uniref:GtrA family protein n=1 Tax=Oceanispirochaeta sp. M1 TaxID=2283433 RepID=UPI0013142B2E|nr:GtrA family protein [Oceanispirochaeta sp. M2]NPD74336.1 GtrA family protein [Oceanispirochaeta sp. M1]
MNLLNCFIHSYGKYKKYIKYIIFGVLTTVLSLISFYILLKMNVEYKLANIISFIIAVLFAYVTNKIYVFEKKSESFKELAWEAFHFFLARVGSFIFDFFTLIICIDVFSFDKMISKIIITVIVIILNYIISEFFIFRKKHFEKPEN